MDFLTHLALAFKVSLDPTNLLMCFIGVFIGTTIGVLPGLGPVTTLSLLLPITYKLSPIQSMIMLAGIYYGAQYGGSTTSILLNIPGEASTMVTCLDGYQMARKGRAGAALGISAIGSFIGGTFALIMMVFLSPVLAGFALRFGPPENASLIALGLVMVTYLSSGSMNKSLMMAAAGLLLGCIGTDLITGTIRFWSGMTELTEGLGIVPVAMGLFGLSEVFLNIEKTLTKREVFETRTKGIKGLLPDKHEFRDSAGPIARGSMVGFFLGLIPGGGALLASFMSYAMERRLSKHPETFGQGDIKGVAGPETANNAAAQGSYIPLMTLGIPPNAIMGVLMGAFLIHGVTPGPFLLGSHPDLFWGVVGSMYIGNVMLLVLNLPLIGMWVQVLKVPYALLFPIILIICLIGSYSVSSDVFDAIVMIVFGIVGYLMKKCDYPAAPLVLALILGPMFEKNLGQSLMMSNGSFTIFFSRLISLVFLLVTFFLLASPPILRLLKKKHPALLMERGDDL